MLRDINLEIKPEANDKSNASGGVSLVKGWLSADHVQRIEIAGRMERGGGLDFSGSVVGIDVSPELMSVLPADQAARLAPLAPLRGQAKLDFHVRNDPKQAQPWQFSVKGQLASGRFDDSRLPQALADMQIDFHADNHGLEIDKLSARNGPTAIQLHAQVQGFQSGAR